MTFSASKWYTSWRKNSAKFEPNFKARVRCTWEVLELLFIVQSSIFFFISSFKILEDCGRHVRRCGQVAELHAIMSVGRLPVLIFRSSLSLPCKPNKDSHHCTASNHRRHRKSDVAVVLWWNVTELFVSCTNVTGLN